MFSFLRKSKIEAPVMKYEDRVIIFRFAYGDRSYRERAIAIHRRYIPILGTHGNGSVEQDFMSEVDNPCPDYMLRSLYRDQVLAQNIQ